MTSSHQKRHERAARPSGRSGLPELRPRAGTDSTTRRAADRNSAAFLRLCEFLRASLHGDAAGTPETDERFWNLLLALALEHFVAPLLYECLERQGRLDAVPEEQKTFLSLCHQLNEARNEKLKVQLIELADALGREGLPTVILKSGAHLFEQNGPGHARSWMMNDLDIFVAAPDQAVQAALGLGYSVIEDLPWGHAVALRHSDHIGIVEVHRDLGPQRHFLNAEEAWASAERLVGVGAPLHKLSATHRVLHNIYHAQIQDRRYQLACPSLQQLAIFDDLVARHEKEIDWAQVHDRFRRLGYLRALHAYIFQAHALLGASVPDTLDRWGHRRAEIHLNRALFQLDHGWAGRALSLWAVLSSNMTRDRVQYRLGRDSTALGRTVARTRILSDTLGQYGFSIFRKIAESRRKRFGR